jgi:hypothetical protein
MAADLLHSAHGTLRAGIQLTNISDKKELSRLDTTEIKKFFFTIHLIDLRQWKLKKVFPYHAIN